MSSKKAPLKVREYQKLLLQTMENLKMKPEFAERYLAGRQVERVNIWLRWNKIMATAEKEPAPDSVISSGEFDREMMNLALSVAQKSPDWWRQIGAILVKDGKPVVTAYNHPEPDDFAQYVDGDPRSNFNWGGDHIHLCSTTHGEIGVIAGAAARGVSPRRKTRRRAWPRP